MSGETFSTYLWEQYREKFGDHTFSMFQLNDGNVVKINELMRKSLETGTSFSDDDIETFPKGSIM